MRDREVVKVRSDFVATHDDNVDVRITSTDCVRSVADPFDAGVQTDGTSNNLWRFETPAPYLARLRRRDSRLVYKQHEVSECRAQPAHNALTH